jgi:hypothetical protein
VSPLSRRILMATPDRSELFDCVDSISNIERYYESRIYGGNLFGMFNGLDRTIRLVRSRRFFGCRRNYIRWLGLITRDYSHDLL